ncbi:MAG: hypothetical protein AAFX53_12760, partial [Bacteroidota bacterium]
SIAGSDLSLSNGGGTVALPASQNITTTNLGLATNRNVSLNGNNLNFDGAGSVGIGTNNPQRKLHINGEVRSEGYANSNGVEDEPSYAFNNDPDTGMWRGASVNFLRFSTAGEEAITIDPNQYVGIGTNNPTEELHVNGDILASGTVTPDYVFEQYFDGFSQLNPEYHMFSLKEIETFVRVNKHLPGVPSSKEIEKQRGILINRATEINLEKIEELFLHTIAQEKKIKELKSKNDTLAKQVNDLQKDLAEIKELLGTPVKSKE